MDPELFEEWMMTGLVTVLILFMAFIVWDLAKKSKAGKFGTLILFFALGLGGHVTPAPRASSNHS